MGARRRYGSNLNNRRDRKSRGRRRRTILSFVSFFLPVHRDTGASFPFELDVDRRESQDLKYMTVLGTVKGADERGTVP